MFTIEEYNKDVKCKTIEHSENVFHEALEYGEKYYHVHNVAGADYDISYKENMEWFEGIVPAYAGKIIPDYTRYDEDERESIDIDFLNAYSRYVCVKLTEYSIAMARIILKYTDKSVYFMDSRISWFIKENDRLHIGEMPEVTEDTVFMVGALGKGYVKGDIVDENSNKKSDIFMFHSAFYLQELLDGRKRSQVKYMEYPGANTVMGIGGILVNTSIYIEFARQLGFELIHNGDRISKFKVEDLNKFFNLDFRREDGTKENTMNVSVAAYVHILWRFCNIPGVMNKDMLVDTFAEELEEYTEAVIGGRRALGVLIRGTDYKSTGFKGTRQQATVEDMVPKIEEWMQKYGYDRIVLATEDQDVLNQMREVFGDKVVAIAQERHTVAEFHKGQIINELEKEIYTEDEYDNRIIETNINYFYALYLLSRCTGFMCSGQNNGWDTVNAMNGGKFDNVYRFAVGVEH